MGRSNEEMEKAIQCIALLSAGNLGTVEKVLEAMQRTHERAGMSRGKARRYAEDYWRAVHSMNIPYDPAWEGFMQKTVGRETDWPQLKFRESKGWRGSAKWICIIYAIAMHGPLFNQVVGNWVDKFRKFWSEPIETPSLEVAAEHAAIRERATCSQAA